VTEDVSEVDLGEYCRRVEDHLTKINGGHLVRIVGPGFQLVRGWAEAGMPLTVVFRGMELKAERHKSGTSRRPLRIEFCQGDVRDVYEGWRRAVGLHALDVASATAEADDDAGPAPVVESKRPSLSKHLERAAERLVRAAGQLELPDAFRDEIARVLDVAASLREEARKARGEARDALQARLPALDAALIEAARVHTPGDVLHELTRTAEEELAPFRARLPGDAWARSMTLTVNGLLRQRYGLPGLDPYAS
jgi:hypothetical protein